MPFIHHL